MSITKNDKDQLDGRDSSAPLTSRRIRGWKALGTPSSKTVENGHKASARSMRAKRNAAKLDEVLGPVEEED